MRLHRPLPANAAVSGLVGAIAALTAADGYAAIAPQYERVRQFGFAMEVAGEAASRLSPHIIDRLEHMDDGTFRFRAGRCFVPVTLEYSRRETNPPVVGAPSHYTVSLGEVRCD